MIEQLFGSKTRVKLLYLFYGNPNRSFYVREITRKIDEQINSVRRELANLLSVGIISSDNSTNRLYYEVNQKYEFYKALNAIFGNLAAEPEKEESEAAAVATSASDAKRWKAVGNISAVIYTGRLTRDDQIDVDIVIIGDANATKVDNLVKEMEATEGTELRYATFTLSEAQYRHQVRDRFWSQLKTAKKQIVIDKEQLFAE